MATFAEAHKEHDLATVNPHLTNGAHPAPLSYEGKDSPVENFRPMKVIVIGAGYLGIYCGIRIPQRLRNVELTIYEKNEGVGGTWWENRYPGCACDIPSHSYQYSFSPNPNWSKFYAPAYEIQAYLESIVEKYSVQRSIRCSHKVVACKWDEDLKKWTVTVQNSTTGETFDDEADVVVSARGTLNDMAWPKVDGFEEMEIPKMHSAAWDDSFQFEGKRIGVIGGGSSAIQIIPELQKRKNTQLNCFVRSKTWISRPLGDSAVGKLGLDSVDFTDEQKERFKNDESHYLQFRSTVEREANSVHALTLKGSPMQKFVRGDFTDLMKRRLSKKPEILESLLPSFSVGCRRLTPGPGYLEALVEPNVNFINTPMRRCLPAGIELADGTTIDLDVLVCATGFQASAPPPFAVVGKNGQTMVDKFNPYPETYLSLATDGFPNYFMMLGPNAAIGTGSLTMMIESAGDYIVKCVRKMQKEDIRAMEAKPARVRDFSKVVDEYFTRTVYLEGCNSWYRSNGGSGYRITGLWPGSALHAIETFRSPRWEDYDYMYESDGADEGEAEDGVNRLKWLGNGWSAVQLEERGGAAGGGGGGDLAFYLQPEFADVPAAPLPEETRTYRLRPFSY